MTDEQDRADAIEMLIADHRAVEELFQSISDAIDPEERRVLLKQIVRELSMHSSVEEQIFYPAVRQTVPKADEIVGEALDEHHDVKERLASLQRMGADDARFDEAIRELMREVRHHVHEEEGEMFPKVRSVMPNRRLAEIGEQMRIAKMMAPTRPHPHAPDKPPANVVTGVVAGVVDRVRDVFER